ncbi:hypothetical protein Acr_15g0000900 [Actinidia rufa]|uniref:Uncharacterized protein n=1 Tax=Actinidia rufa TaxID=165716 RepID=A0A7J0FS27_9ERIC|nr:hypothetical protein Acr_15g0000900 [Actinidia rufa]
MDKGSNRCTEVRKASAGVLGGSVMVPGGSRVVQERREMLLDMYRSLARHEWCNQCRMSIESSEEGDQVDFEKLYSEGCGDAEASLFCSRLDQWRCSLQMCAQGRRDGATTTRKVTYFAAHPRWGVRGGGHPSGGVQGTSVRRCRHFGVEVHTLRWEVE